MIIIVYSWRITKYDPDQRDEDGHYLHDEWTSFSDIGKEFNGEKLDYYSYFRVEMQYVNVILAFKEYLGLSHLKVKELELYEEHYNLKNLPSPTNEVNIDYSFAVHPIYLRYYQKLPTYIEEGFLLKSHTEIMAACSLILRDVFWCKLVADTKLQVHFGFDFYMYVVSSENCNPVIEKFKESKILFVEEYESPYL
ncbi:hypothetical protein [Paenibacillus agricola]|uniref:Uncharacterized protein n=1 Tax=Paenibacillus agricola TaxID=2716264 RepID=A0ABX0JFX9_9BACL|nr:hypothetical protein [Paenibacillus agricola]NHN34686.1 hypothetical protein [Paenibacillus agricola]